MEVFGLTNRVEALIEDGVEDPALVKELPSLFQRIKFPHKKYKMILPEGSQPVVHHARRMPHASYEPVKTKLHRMKKGDILKKLDAPSNWIGPLVIARKEGGELRVISGFR